MLFQWMSSVGLRKPLNDLGAPIAHVNLFTNEVITIELGNPKLVMVACFSEAKPSIIERGHFTQAWDKTPFLPGFGSLNGTGKIPPPRALFSFK